MFGKKHKQDKPSEDASVENPEAEKTETSEPEVQQSFSPFGTPLNANSEEDTTQLEAEDNLADEPEPDEEYNLFEDPIEHHDVLHPELTEEPSLSAETEVAPTPLEDTQAFSSTEQNTQAFSEPSLDPPPVEEKIGQRPAAPVPYAVEGDGFLMHPDNQKFIKPQTEEFVPVHNQNNRKLHTTWAVGTLFLVLVVGALVFFYQDGRLNSSRDIAVDEARKAGKLTAEAQYQPGANGYNTIFNKGKASGQQAGNEAGQENGIQEGRDGLVEELDQASPTDFDPAPEGDVPNGNPAVLREAANAALGGFSDWSTSALYSVSLADGPGIIPFQIIARTRLEPNKFYRICKSKSGQLCEVSIPKKGSASGISENQADKQDPETDATEEENNDTKTQTTPTTPTKPKTSTTTPSIPSLPPDPTEPSTAP